MKAFPPAHRVRLSEHLGARGSDIAAIELSVHEAGSGPAVVMCHGFPELAYSWRHQLETLAEGGFRAIVPDMRGYGASGSPEAIEDFDLEHFVDITHGYVGADLAALAREAAMKALRRYLPDIDLEAGGSIPSTVLENLQVTNDDFKEAFREVVRLEPHYLRGWYNLGTFLARQGRRDEAREALVRGRDPVPQRDGAVALSPYERTLVDFDGTLFDNRLQDIEKEEDSRYQ